MKLMRDWFKVTAWRLLLSLTFLAMPHAGRAEDTHSDRIRATLSDRALEDAPLEDAQEDGALESGTLEDGPAVEGLEHETLEEASLLVDQGEPSLLSRVRRGRSGKGKSRGGLDVYRARTFGGFEFLHWWNKGRDLPPLVTGGDPTTTAFSAAGVLPTAPTLFGNEAVGDDRLSGGRLTTGLWLDDDHCQAMVVTAYGVEGDQTSFIQSSDGSSILAIPFEDRSAALFGLENALVLAYSGGVTAGINAQGSVDARAANDVFGGDVVLRRRIRSDCDYRVDLLAGYKFTRIDDDLALNTSLTRFDIAGTPQFLTQDLFDVENEYHAGQLGMLAECTRGPLTVQMVGKIGLGNMRQRVRIDGSYQVISGGATSGPGGIFAQTTPPLGGPTFNRGSYERDVTVWSPEAQIKAIYAVNDDIAFSIGYTFLYWNGVALAGDQIDRRVNRDILYGGAFQPGGGANPAFTFNDTDFWVQTVDLGVTIRY